MFDRPTPRAPSPNVQTQVGVAAREAVREAAVGMVMMAIAPPGTTPLHEVAPRLLVRRLEAATARVEQVRISSLREVALLPGLDGSVPSRVRDAARLAITAGAASLDLVLVHHPQLMPWDLGRPDLPSLLDPFHDNLFGALVLYPDAAGPWTPGTPDDAERPDAWDRLFTLFRVHARGWASRYQIALLDAGHDRAGRGARFMPRLFGADAVVCRFDGAAEAMGRHGWRSPAAAVAGLLLSFNHEVYRGPTGQTVQLGEGRRPRPRPRFVAAAPPAPTSGIRDSDVCTLELHEDGETARVRSEPTLRRPREAWTLAALRTAKLVHRRVVEAAEAVVFRPANEAHAFALVAAIDMAIRPFVTHGLLVGPSGAGTPLLESNVVRDRSTPGLVATITGRLQPWCTQVSVRVEVREGGGVSMQAKA